MEFAQTRGRHLRNLGGELLDEACGTEGFEDPEPTRLTLTVRLDRLLFVKDAVLINPDRQ